MPQTPSPVSPPGELPAVFHARRAGAVSCWKLKYSEYVHQISQGSVATGWFGSRVVSTLDSGAEGPVFKLRRCRVTVLGKLFTPIVPLFSK